MEIIKRNINKIIILFLVILIIIIILLNNYLNNSNKNEITKEDNLEIVENKDLKEQEKETKINVDIKGAVINPGVYELEDNKKVIDLVTLAGGLTDAADTTYINLAKKLSDEMVVIIYTKDQIKKAKEKETLSLEDINNTCVCPKISNDACITKEDTKSNKQTKNNNSSTNSKTDTSDSNKKDSNDKVNINTATEEELQNLSGIGASKAKSIIEYREENGNFTKIEDILNVNGIGESVYEKIKDNITI